MYKKHKHPNQPFHIFIIKRVDIIGKTFTLLIIIYALLCIYVKHDTNMDPLKATVLKITYTKKATFTVSDTIIHSSLAIPIHKTLSQITNLSDEKRNIFIKKYDQLKVLMLDEISFISHRMLTFVDRKLSVMKHVDNSFLAILMWV